jgi:hypothetical protein
MAYQTVREFTYIEFDQNWTPGMGTDSQLYTAMVAAQLLLLSEDVTGAKTTYTFKLNKGDVVIVSRRTNLAFIPARCFASAAGDKTKCAPK